MKNKISLSCKEKEIAPIFNEDGHIFSSLGVYLELSPEDISPDPNQPRKFFDKEKISELSESIAHQGMLQPIVVRKDQNNNYIILAGERRWRAAKKLSLKKIPVIEKTFSEKSIALSTLVENIQREDLSPLEEARALKNLSLGFDMSHEEIARQLGCSRTSVTNSLRLLLLSPKVQKMMEKKLISVGHAKVLLGFSSDVQKILSDLVLGKNLSVRELEKISIRYKKQEKNKKNFKFKKDHERCLELSLTLSKNLCTNVSVKLNQSGEGRVIIDIQSLSQMNTLLTLLTEKI